MVEPQRQFIRDYHEAWWDSLDAGMGYVEAHFNASGTAHSLCTSSIGPVMLKYRLQYELSAIARCAPEGTSPGDHVVRLLTPIWHMHAEPATREAVSSLRGSGWGRMESSAWVWKWVIWSTAGKAEIFMLDELAALRGALAEDTGRTICAEFGTDPVDVAAWAQEHPLAYDPAHQSWHWHYGRWGDALRNERLKATAGWALERRLASATTSAASIGLQLTPLDGSGTTITGEPFLALRDVGDGSVTFRGSLGDVEVYLLGQVPR